MNIKYNSLRSARSRGGWAVLALLGLCSALSWAADPVTQAVDTTINANKAAAASQQRVSATDDQSKQLLERYRAALWQSQQLTVYAQQLQQLVASQDLERQSLERQIGEIDRTERDLLPLMLRMVDTLEKFTQLDLPFLNDERSERIANLRRLMADPGRGVAEKYQRILEAYQIEADYGRSLGAERSEVEGKVVDVLRVGRTALYYLAMDGKQTGYWNAQAAVWEPLDRRYAVSVRKGIRIARETQAADYLMLPVPVAGSAP